MRGPSSFSLFGLEILRIAALSAKYYPGDRSLKIISQCFFKCRPNDIRRIVLISYIRFDYIEDHEIRGASSPLGPSANKHRLYRSR